ncbi:amine oxidase [Micractinium conductrix]|uniref:Amine oxidase n=1 Tax=Micractinium conductrix TaxID=554055 RepID=A0A2P6V4Q8_9CHLO|nr:amine oxidase [Micractinium conductrix]|eukprot:PSC69064.1 amine oxidase [Micractinium conductrix]
MLRLQQQPCSGAAAQQAQAVARLPTATRRHRLSVTAAASPTTGADNGRPTGPGAKKVLVVGGGWAGFGAVKHLAEQGYNVTLLDAAENPGGLSAGWRTPQGRAVEAGVKGFWYQYHNVFKMVKELGIPWPFTDFETSGFWGSDGKLITQAPVFSKQPRLPAILGQFVHTFNLFDNLPLANRATIIPWLYSAIDLGSTPGNYERYDKMTALEMFRSFGVTQRAYEQFLKPTLLVGLFAPPEELSAAVTIETLYFYALAHQSDFDVCWCKGSVSELIFAPLIERIKQQGGKIQGGRLVSGIETDAAGNVTALVARNTASGAEERYEADAVVFAISIAGMQRLVQANRALADRREFRDSTASRLASGLTAASPRNLHDEYKNEPGTVVAADFYGSTRLMPLTDEEIVRKVVSNMALCEPAFRDAKVVDSAVLRFPRAVTHFSPGSAQWRPTQATSFGNLFLAGDWVKGLQHGANGLSQERAYVSGLEAANLVVGRLGHGERADILPVEPDEPHIAAAKELNRSVKGALYAAGMRSPFL